MVKEIIEKAKKIAIIYDIDSDGICSGIIAYHTLRKLGKEIVLTNPGAPKLSDFVMNLIEESDADLVITVDLSVDVSKDAIAASSKEWLVIDHHQITHDLNELDNVTHRNLILDGDDTYCPASKYIYDLFSEAFGEIVEKYDWLSCIGLIGDAAYPIYKEFVKGVLKKYGEGFSNDPYETKFGEMDKIVSSGRLYKGGKGAVRVYETLKEVETIDEFEEKAGKLKEWDKIVSTAIKKELEEFEEKMEVIDGIIFYNLQSRLNIGSPITGITANRHKHKTVVIHYERNGTIKLHLRRVDGKIDLSRVARDIGAEFEGASGGGHPKASGAHVPSENWEEYKEKLINRLKSE